MITALSTKEHLRLETLFVIPLITQQMIEGTEPLDDVAEYTFHEILTELRPDTALLSISLCAYHIAQSIEGSNAAKVLQIQAADMINEYGPIWLAHEAQDPDLNNMDVQKALAFIPEDLEAMADTLDLLLSEMGDKHEIAYILTDILSLQAHMHKDLALVELERVMITPLSREEEEQKAEHQEDIQKLCTAGNVIAFPVLGSRRNAEHVRS